jgi:hypothetical protein
MSCFPCHISSTLSVTAYIIQCACTCTRTQICKVDIFTYKDGTAMHSWNIGNELSINTIQYPIRVRASKDTHISYVIIFITYLLTPYSTVLLEKLPGLQLVKKFPAFMEPEGSLPHSQGPASRLYPETAHCTPHPHIPLPEDLP